MRRGATGLLAAFLATWLCSAGPRAEEDSQPKRRLTLLFTTDLYGRFVEASCKRRPDHDFANLVGAIDALRAQLRAAGEPPPLVLNGGDNIGPRAFARYVLSKGKAGGQLIASWLKRAGYELVALGNQDFYAVTSRLENYLRAGKAAGLTFSAANLDCADPQAGLCPSIGTGPNRFVMLERGGLRIAVLSLIHRDLAGHVPATRLEGIQVADPIKRAPQVIAAARQAGADLVIVLSHIEHAETSPLTTLELARTVPDADLIIANAFTSRLDERGIGVIRFADGASPVLGCDLMGQHLCRADLRLVRKGDRYQIVELRSGEVDLSRSEPDRQVREQIERQLRDYCAEWDQPVGQGRLAQAMNAERFGQYLLEIMRQVTASELAFINRGLVDAHSVFPLEDTITRHDFFVSLPHSNKLYTFSMTGKDVVALCDQLEEEEATRGQVRLVSRGLVCGAQAKVNGRIVDPMDRYTAVTIEYLAKGIGGYFKAPGLALRLFRPHAEAEPPILGEVARAFLSSPPFTGPRPEPIDLETNFPDLARKLRWNLAGAVHLNLTDTSISNPRNYEQSQLVREEFTALKGELRGRVDAHSILHGLSFDARLKYARSRATSGQWIESEDLTTFNAIYRLMALREAESGWYAPIPYAEGQLETELTRPEDDPSTPEVNEERDYHHLELTTTLGSRFALTSRMEVKVGLGLRRELLDGAADTVFGLDLGYTLAKIDLFSLMDSPLQMESELAVFFGDVGRSNSLKGTWTNRFYFSLIGPIYFNITHELFVYRYSTWQVGAASDLTFGLSYNAQTAVQTF